MVGGGAVAGSGPHYLLLMKVLLKHRNLTGQYQMVVIPSQIPVRAEEESRECREQEYKDQLGNCKPCKQCDAGQELSKVWGLIT